LLLLLLLSFFGLLSLMNSISQKSCADESEAHGGVKCGD
jgi:hypothetical protein